MNCHWNFGPGKMLLVSVQWLWKQINKGHAKFNDLGRGYSLVGVI